MKHTIHPHSVIYRIWQAIVLIAVFTSAFLHTYTACFTVEEFTGASLRSVLGCLENVVCDDLQLTLESISALLFTTFLFRHVSTVC